MKDFYSKKSKENGITLVALVVTIIVLLIMATITIYNIAGDDSSLLTSVETQREDLLKMEAKQAIEVAAEKVKLKNAGTSLKFKDFKDQLKEELQKDDADSEVISSDFSSDDNTPMYDATFNGYTFSYFYVEDINNLIEITYKQDKEKYTQSGNAKITTTVEEAKILYYYFEGIKPEEITAKELANIKWNTYDLDATAEYPLSIKCNGTLYAKLDINGSSSDSIYKQVINIDCLQPIIENVNVDNKVYGQLTFKADITDAPETAKSLSS